MRATIILLLLLPVICFLACKKRHHNLTKSFYYWKTAYKPTAYELDRLRQVDVHKMYIRMFDVDYDEHAQHAMPVAPIRMDHTDTGLYYVPVVFITQRALTALNEKDINQLAGNICSFTKFLCERSHITTLELQIDCDWTGNTKGKYFALLRAIREQPYMQNKMLSCTIRLNQVKYSAYNGIPPADKGLVMCYGMGNLKKYGPYNSILDAGEAKDYLKHIGNYPLPLDVALPLFEWCVLYRDKQYKGIMHEIATDAVKTSSLFQHKNGNLYQALYDTIWQGYKFNINDIIRLERTQYKDILTTARYTAQQINNADVSVIFFDCDSITLSKFSNNELETIYTGYR